MYFCQCSGHKINRCLIASVRCIYDSNMNNDCISGRELYIMTKTKLPALFLVVVKMAAFLLNNRK